MSTEYGWLGSTSHSDTTSAVYHGCKARNQPKSIYIYLTSLFFIAALSESSEKLTYYKSHPGAKVYRHYGLRMNTAQDVTDITCQLMYGLFLMF